jgi:hypothetical protein
MAIGYTGILFLILHFVKSQTVLMLVILLIPSCRCNDVKDIPLLLSCRQCPVPLITVAIAATSENSVAFLLQQLVCQFAIEIRLSP